MAAGEVSPSSAILWAHATKSGSYTLQVAAKKNFKKRAFEKSVKATSGNDNTVQAKAGKLKPGKRYYYRFVGKKGRKSATGTFRTAPKASANATLEFGWTGDTDFNSAPGQTTPFWNTGGIFKRMRAEENAFNIHFGDTMYSDSEIPGRLQPIALTVKAKWAKYRTNLENKHLRGLRGSAGFFSHWDDHEFVNDFSPRENTFSNDVNINGRTLYKRGVDAFRDYAPVRYSSENGLYRTVRWGRNASSSSSTSARSGARRPTRAGSATTPRRVSRTWRRPRRRRSATCSLLSSRRSRSPSRRRASTRSAPSVAPTSARASCRGSSSRSGRRMRASRS